MSTPKYNIGDKLFLDKEFLRSVNERTWIDYFRDNHLEGELTVKAVAPDSFSIDPDTIYDIPHGYTFYEEPNQYSFPEKMFRLARDYDPLSIEIE